MDNQPKPPEDPPAPERPIPGRIAIPESTTRYDNAINAIMWTGCMIVGSAGVTFAVFIAWLAFALRSV